MSVQLFALPGIPFVEQGDDLVALISDGLKRAGLIPESGDIFVLAQKIVSKAEGRIVDLAMIEPSPRASELAARTEHDPRLVELVLSESVAIVMARPGLLLVEHRLGFVMPNAGIDQSNIGFEKALLLPVDPDVSAKALRERLSQAFGVDVAVVINDSVSRPWRAGTCGIAIGAAGLPVLDDLRGLTDLFGRKLQFSITGHADEIAATASLLMGQRDEGTPVVLIRGLVEHAGSHGLARELSRRPTIVSPQRIERVQRDARMLDYVYGHDQAIADFVASLIPHAQRGFTNCKAIGIIENGALIAGMVYHNYDPEAAIIEMSGASLPGKYWLTARTLVRIYEYPFLQLDCQMTVMRVPSDDVRLLGILAAFNYTLITIPRLFGRDRDGVVCTLTREAWEENRFNKRRRREAANMQEAA